MKTAISIVLLVIGGLVLFYYFQLVKPQTSNPVSFNWQYSQQDVIYYFDTAKLSFSQDSSSIRLTDANNVTVAIAKTNSSNVASTVATFFTTWTTTTAGNGTLTVPANCKYLTLTVHYPRTATSKLEDDIEQLSCQNTLPADKKLDTFQDSDLPPYDQTGV